MEKYAYVKENYLALCEEIDRLSGAVGQDVSLVAVTKSGSDEELIALMEAGCREIGENRPQLLSRRGKILANLGYYPTLHQIGHLQRNKVRSIIDSVGLIHSVDSLSLAGEINRVAELHSKRARILIEVNSAREEQKGGVFPEDAEALLQQILPLKNISVAGLMTMGPVADEEEIRRYFRITKNLFDRLNEHYGFDGGVLSMGMSDSYRVAIEEGATLVRIGRRLFMKNE